MANGFKGGWYIPIIIGRLIGSLAPRETKGYDMITEDAIPWRQVCRGTFCSTIALASLLFFFRWFPFWDTEGNFLQRWVVIAVLLIIGALLISIEGILRLRVDLESQIRTTELLNSLRLALFGGAGVSIVVACIFIWIFSFFGFRWYTTHSLYTLEAWKELGMQTLLWNLVPSVFIYSWSLAIRSRLEVINPWWQQWQLISPLLEVFKEAIKGVPAEKLEEVIPAIVEGLEGEGKGD